MKKNIIPIIGFVVGFGLIIWSITSSGNIASFIDAPSLLITLGGSFCALLISFPLKSIMKIPAIIKNLLHDPTDHYEELIAAFSELSRKARSQGVLAIEEDLQQQDNELMVTGLQMVVDGLDPELIEEILEIKTENIEKRHRMGQEIFLKWGEMAPAYGMIGTLIGLIIMLGELNDPSTIGTGMATALITTLYGSFLANMLFLPIATNLKLQTEKEMQMCEMVIEGILSIQAGQNPRVIEQKLYSYLRDDNQEESVKEAARLEREGQQNG